MIPYFILILLPVLLWVAGETYRVKCGKRLLLETRSASIDVFMLMFFFLLACRGIQCGTDTKQYLRLFNEYSIQSIPHLFSKYEREFGYRLLNRLIGVIGGNYQTLLIVTAFICVVPLWYFFRKESESQLLTIALFLTVAPYIMYFSGIQQAIAMSLGVPAWYAAKSKKLGRFILWVLLAMQFHTSAFMLLLLYPLFRAKITTKWLWFVVPCMALVYVFRSTIFNFLFKLLWYDYTMTKATDATTILFLLILFGVYSYIMPGDNISDDTVAMRNILLLSIVLQIFAMLHPLSMRMNYYFLLFIPVLIPKIADQSKKQFAQISKLSVVVMTVYFMCYFVKKVVTDIDSLNIFPYIPFWQNGSV